MYSHVFACIRMYRDVSVMYRSCTGHMDRTHERVPTFARREMAVRLTGAGLGRVRPGVAGDDSHHVGSDSHSTQHALDVLDGLGVRLCRLCCSFCRSSGVQTEKPRVAVVSRPVGYRQARRSMALLIWVPSHGAWRSMRRRSVSFVRGMCSLCARSCFGGPTRGISFFG